MYRNGVEKKMILALLILVLVSITIGYAIISSNLKMNGTASISKTGWSIYFDNVSVTAGSVEAELPSISEYTTLTYSAALTKPGEYYELLLM